MIDIESGKKEFINHVQKIEIDNPRVDMKIGHTMRVVENCKKIATAIGLEEEQIQLAELIGLLHDIGRFEQYQKFDKKTDTKALDDIQKFDHGEAGVKVLKENNYIRNYIAEDTYDDIIYTAIYEHNKYEIAKDLPEDKVLFCKFI